MSNSHIEKKVEEEEEDEEFKFDEEKGCWKVDKETEESLKKSGYGFLLKNKNVIPHKLSPFIALAKRNKK